MRYCTRRVSSWEGGHETQTKQERKNKKEARMIPGRGTDLSSWYLKSSSLSGEWPPDSSGKSGRTEDGEKWGGRKGTSKRLG